MINKSRKNSFFGNNLKNNSESNISNNNQGKNLAPVNNLKNHNINVFSEFNRSKNKINSIGGDIMSPNFNNEFKNTNRIVYSVDKDSKIPGNPHTNFLNKLTFDNVINKKSINSLIIQPENNPNINDKIKNSNLINSSNNSNNQNSEKVIIISGNKLGNIGKLSKIIGSKSNTNNINNSSSVTNIGNIAINNVNNLNNLSNLKSSELIVNLNQNLNNLSGHPNDLGFLNHNFNSDNFNVPVIPNVQPQQINVNINNYNINNFNIQSSVPMKKKYFKFENLSMNSNLNNNSNSNNINMNSNKISKEKNLEYELSPRTSQHINSNIFSGNNFNLILNSNNNLNNNESVTRMNFENKELINLKKNSSKINQSNNGRFIGNKAYEDNILNEKNSSNLFFAKEREGSLSTNEKNFKEKEGNKKNLKSVKIIKDENSGNHLNDLMNNGKNVKNLGNLLTGVKETSNVQMRSVSNKEIIFNPCSSTRQLESLVKPTEINNDSVINELADLFSANYSKDKINNNNNSFFNSIGKDLKLDTKSNLNMNDDLNLNLNKYFFSENKHQKNSNNNINLDKFENKPKNIRQRESHNHKNNEHGENINEISSDLNKMNNNIIINKKLNLNIFSNDKNERTKKNIKIKIENIDNKNFNTNLNGINPNILFGSSNNNGFFKVSNGDIMNNNFNINKINNINNININNINKVINNKINIQKNTEQFNKKAEKPEILKKDIYKENTNFNEIDQELVNGLNNNINLNNDFNFDSLIENKNFVNDNSLSLKNSTFLEDFNHEIPDPRINFDQLKKVNSRRPQTSYGGISERQKKFTAFT